MMRTMSDKTRFSLLLCLLLSFTGAIQANEIERGRQVFKLCEGCHSVVPGEHLYGPSVAGLVGRPAGKLKGYNFSDDLGNVKFKWDPKHLEQWLGDEAKNMVPGTRMEFPGITDKGDLQALIKYLATVKAKK